MEIFGLIRRAGARRMGALVLAVLLTGLLAGCTRGETDPSASSSAGEERETVDELRLEFAPTGGDPETLLQSLRSLQEKLPAVLAEAGADVHSVTLTVGTSVSATGQALAESSVDAALFPTGQALAAFGGESHVLATRGYAATLCSGRSPKDWNTGENAAADSWTPGQRMLICAGPSEYGQRLAQRVRDGKDLSWEELRRAHWAVAGEGQELAALWLSDTYAGSTLADLPHCTDCGCYEAALAGLAEETADLAVVPADLRIALADRWTMDPTRTAADGEPGLGRGASVWTEVTVVGVSEPLYTQTLAAAAESPWAEEPLAAALTRALCLLEQDPDFQTLGGSGPLVRLSDPDLDAARRLAALEEEP